MSNTRNFVQRLPQKYISAFMHITLFLDQGVEYTVWNFTLHLKACLQNVLFSRNKKIKKC